MRMQFEEDEEWDLELIHNLVRKEEEAIAAKRRKADPAAAQPRHIQPRQAQPPASWAPAPFPSSLVREDMRSSPVVRPHHKIDAAKRPVQSQVASYHASIWQQGEWRPAVAPLLPPPPPPQPDAERTIREPSHPSLQREIERLSAQLLFKDQELLEARRIYAEKEEQLKVAIQDLENVKKSYDNFRQQPEALKDGKGESNLPSKYNLLEPNVTVAGCSGCSPTDTKIAGSVARVENGSYMNKNQHTTDLWLPPWTTEAAPVVPDDKELTQRPVSQGKPMNHDTSNLPIAELKHRTSDNGCTSLAQHENICSMDFIEVQQPSCEKPISLESGARDLRNTTVAHETLAYKQRLEENCCVDSQKLLDKLSSIWSTEKMTDAFPGLISKLFANCRAELCVLLSTGYKYLESAQEFTGSSPDLYEILDKIEKQIDNENISFDCLIRDNKVEWGFPLVAELFSIIAKVANGLASSWDLFTFLMKYCNSKDMEVVQSSLHILRFILIHDTNCGQILFERTWQLNPRMNEQVVGLKVEKDMTEESQKCENNLIPCMVETKKFDSTKPWKHFCVHSPRIFIKVEGVDRQENQKQINDINKTDLVNVQDGASRSGHCQDVSQGFNCNRVLRFFNWILNFSLKAATVAVKFEATAILTLLVMHTEPIAERKIFSSLVAEGSVASLLNRSSGLDVQMQAVRLLHFLLHCPSMLEMLCTAEGEQKHISGNMKADNHCPVTIKDKGLTYEGSHSDKMLPIEAEGCMDEPSMKGRQRQVLENLSCCLFCMGHSLQAYALRRYALRVLTYIATSGNIGAAAVMSMRVASHKDCLQKDVGADVVSIPVSLLSLLNTELSKMEEDNASSMTPFAEERGCLIQEALTLLCHLAYHSTQSLVVMAALTTHKATIRLSISVLNRLIYRCSFVSSVHFQDMKGLAKGLRRRLLAGLSDS